MTATLEQLLETLVRPALRAHNGDVELVGYRTVFFGCGCWASAPAVPPPP